MQKNDTVMVNLPGSPYHNKRGKIVEVILDGKQEIVEIKVKFPNPYPDSPTSYVDIRGFYPPHLEPATPSPSGTSL